MTYNDISLDKDLVLKAQAGDKEAENALVNKYVPLAEGISRGFSLKGGDSDDLKQIAMIALMEAVRSYDVSRVAEFKTYASVCIRNRLLDAVRSENLGKNSIFNNSIRMEDDQNESSVLEIPSLELTPEQQYIAKEAERAFYDALGSILGERDVEVIKLYLACVPYKEISQKLGITSKKVDNTIYNAKKKIAKIIETLKQH